MHQAARLMKAQGRRRLPVIHDSRLLGLIGETDIVIGLISRAEWEHARTVRMERAFSRARVSRDEPRVIDLMSSPALTIAPDASVQETVAKMGVSGITSLLVTEGETASGILTTWDVVTRCIARELRPEQIAVSEIMSSPITAVPPDLTARGCLEHIGGAGMQRFPVIHDERIIGIISLTDIMAYLTTSSWNGLWTRRAPTSYIVADIMRAGSGQVLEESGGVSPELTLWECAAELAGRQRWQLPVRQTGRVIGVVSEADILVALGELGGAH